MQPGNCIIRVVSGIWTDLGVVCPTQDHCEVTSAQLRQWMNAGSGKTSPKGKELQTWYDGGMCSDIWNNEWPASEVDNKGGSWRCHSWPGAVNDTISFFFFSFFFFFFPFICISWRLITLQYCSGFCHTLTWISHRFTCIPHPDPPSHLPLYPIPSLFRARPWGIY